MLHPKIIISERDGRLAEQLRPLAMAERWVLREPRQADPLWRILQSGGPTVLVVKIGGSPDQELSLIERVSWQLPDIATVAVGDLDSPAVLAGLAWEVGAAYVLFPPQSRDLLPDIAAGLMRRTIRATIAPVPAGAEASP